MEFDDERREMFSLRCKITDQVNYHRGRYGNKDGKSSDGSYRRYDNPLFQDIEDKLFKACTAIFEAEQLIFTRQNINK